MENKAFVEILDVLMEFFDDDFEEVKLFLVTSNPLFGNVSPAQLIQAGRADKVLQVIEIAIEETE